MVRCWGWERTKCERRMTNGDFTQRRQGTDNICCFDYEHEHEREPDAGKIMAFSECHVLGALGVLVVNPIAEKSGSVKAQVSSLKPDSQLSRQESSRE